MWKYLRAHKELCIFRNWRYFTRMIFVLLTNLSVSCWRVRHVISYGISKQRPFVGTLLLTAQYWRCEMMENNVVLYVILRPLNLSSCTSGFVTQYVIAHTLQLNTRAVHRSNNPVVCLLFLNTVYGRPLTVNLSI
jgi:hypothetical protein